MKKAILLFALLLSAMNMMAQAYEFTTEGDKYGFTFKMNKYVYTNMGIYAKLSLMEDINPLVEDTKHGLFLELYDTGYDVPRQIYEKIGEGMRLNIRLILKNHNIIDFREHYIGKTEDKDKHGIQINLNCGDTDFSKLIASNIAGVGIFGLSEEPMIMLLPSFNSAASLKAMYDKFRSSSVSSGPSATCELGYVGVTSEGNIYCRVDNVTISGAKGKDVSICAFFEAVNNDDVCVFEKKLLSLPYDNCTYNSLRVKGNVNDYSMLTKHRIRKYKVTISVFMGDHNIYDSNVKYITIYNDQGSWRSN